MQFVFSLACIFLVAASAEAAGPAAAAANSKPAARAAKAGKIEPIGALDLLIFHASQVNSIGEWIERFTPEKDRESRRRLLKPILGEKFPPLLREQNTLFFPDRSEKKIGNLVVLPVSGWTHMFLGGMDVTQVPGEATDAWIARVLKMGGHRSAARGVPFVSEAHADDFTMGLLLGIAVMAASSDVTMMPQYLAIPPTLENLPREEIGRLRAMMQETLSKELDKRMPNLAEVQKAKAIMRGLVLKEMHSMEIACIEPTGNAKYHGARFRAEIQGKTLDFTSMPQTEVFSLRLKTSDANAPGADTDLIYNQASKSYFLQRRTNGEQKSISGTQGKDKGALLEAIAAPYILDERIAHKSTDLTKEEQDSLKAWSDGPGKAAFEKFDFCMHLSNAIQDRTLRYAYTAEIRAIAEKARGLERKPLLSACAQLNAKDLKRGELYVLPTAWNPWGELWARKSKLEDQISAAKKEIENLSENYRYFVDNHFCRDLPSPDAPVQASRWEHAFAPKRASSYWLYEQRSADNCYDEFIGQAKAQNVKAYQDAKARIDADIAHNKESAKLDQEYQSRLKGYRELTQLAEAVTSCCRMEDCRQAMATEQRVIDSKGADKVDPKGGAKAQ